MTAAAALCASTGYETVALLTLVDLGLVAGFQCAGMPVRAALEY